MFSLYSFFGFIAIATAQFVLFPSDSFPTSLSTACATALNKSISCDPYLLQVANEDYYGELDSTTQANICTSACTASLSGYRSSVLKACQTTPQPWPGVPSTFYGDLVWSSYNLTCLKDAKTGQWCNEYISQVVINSDANITTLNKTTQCSTCILALFQHIQSTAYSGYNDDLASDWSAVQETCGVSYPTAVQPAIANITVPGYSTFSGTATCISGKTYTVASGDTCETIAEAHSVAAGTLRTINSLLPDCSDLLGGQVLCLPQSCTTYKVLNGDTCASIAAAYSISLQALYSYNPTISTDCSNLIAGATICVGSPYATWNGTAISGATPVQTAVYATATVTPPGTVGHGTTRQCGKYYQVQSGDICQKVALNNTISITLFEAINPSINLDCSNLTPGLWYCVQPTANWNATSSGGTATTVVAPAPTTSGTTSQCYEWYTVQHGDYCYLIETSYNITFAQLQAWNPSLNADCTNLSATDAYCVSGPPVSTR